jgi:hypothetical protein
LHRALLIGALLSAQLSFGAAISLTNSGFNTDLSGWTTTGNVQSLGPTSVQTFNNIIWDITPAGPQMAAMNSNGAIANTLDAFFGLPGNTLQSLNLPGTHADPNAGGSLTNGSGMYQDFSAQAGDTVTMYYNYVARDYIPFNDPAFSVLVAPDGTFQAQTLSSIYGGGIEVGTAGNSGWRTISYTLDQTGTYRLGFAVVNDRDTVLDAALFIDDAPGSTGTENPGGLVPGSTPLFPLLPDSSGFGTFGWTNPQPGFWYDPPYAEAYTYELFGDDAFFSEFATPPAGFGYGDLVFTDLDGSNGSFTASAGVTYNITPTKKFTISGIPNLLIDFQSPDFATAFPAYLNWTGTADQLSISITPQDSPNVPEPSAFLLVTGGLIPFIWRARRRAA